MLILEWKYDVLAELAVTVKDVFCLQFFRGIDFLPSSLKHSFAVLLPRLLESQRLDKRCQGGFELIDN